MSDFINTTDSLGDDAVCDGIIMKTLSEYVDDHIAIIGDYVFYNCTKMTKLDLPNADSVGVFSFYGCSTLNTVNLPVAVSIGNYAFNNCYALESVSMPLATTVGKSAFRNCNNLVSIDLPVTTSMDTYTFYGCSSLTTVILRSETMCELADTNAFGNTPIESGTGYIYVPDELVETYASGTNWAAYSLQIKSLSELEG